MRPVTTAFASLALLASLATPALAVNVLTDPGFESNPLNPGFISALNNFPLYQNTWGVENGAITTATQGITPAGGNNMLYLASTGVGVTSQGGQVVDLSGIAAQIDAGLVQVAVGALFNTNAPNAIGGVYLSYFSAANNSSPIGGNPLSVLNFDSNPSTWELAAFNDNVPVGTRWVVMQAAYDANSIAGFVGSTGTILEGGFVDDAYLDVRFVPEPAALSLGLLPGLFLRRRSR
jgi:hypothetical protein